MPINTNSRYVSSVLQTIEGPNGTVLEARVAFPKARRIAYTSYRVIEGDRIETIAVDFYGDAQMWWKIADANPEVLDWSAMAAPAHEGLTGRGCNPGDVIRVPDA